MKFSRRPLGEHYRAQYLADPEHKWSGYKHMYIPDTRYPLLYKMDGDQWHGRVPHLRKTIHADSLSKLVVLAIELVEHK